MRRRQWCAVLTVLLVATIAVPTGAAAQTDEDRVIELLVQVVNVDQFDEVISPADLIEAEESGPVTSGFLIEGGRLADDGQLPVFRRYANQSWERFKELFPEEIWGRFTNFSLSTARDNVVTFPSGYGTDDFYSLLSTHAVGGYADFVRIHEVGHLLTLDQVDIDYDRETSANRPIGVTEACPTGEVYSVFATRPDGTFSGNGCAREDTLMARWAQEFWPLEFTREASNASTTGEIADFFRANSDQFRSAYSATNSAEDFAEAFSAFVYFEHPYLVNGKAKPGASIKEQKIAWFYAQNDMVELRNFIINRLEPKADRPTEPSDKVIRREVFPAPPSS